MTYIVGRDIDLTWDGTAITGLREKGISLNNEPIDVTNDGSSGWRELLDKSATDSVDISISGVQDDGFPIMADAFSSDKSKAVVVTYDNGDTITGTFRIASYEQTGVYNGETTFSAQLQSTGAVTYTAA